MAGASGIGQLKRPAILFGIAGLFGWGNFSECWSVVAQADGVHEGVFTSTGATPARNSAEAYRSPMMLTPAAVRSSPRWARCRGDVVSRQMDARQGRLHGRRFHRTRR